MADVADNFVASTTFSASGFYAVSGDQEKNITTAGPNAASGDFYVRTQSLDFDYVRHAHPGWNPSITLTLSGFTATRNPNHSDLVVLVRASTRVQKVNAAYGTSSFVQPQKFQINSVSSDPEGNSYGTTVLAANRFGPMGTCITKQQYYERRPWDPTKDVEYNFNIQGCNVAYATSSYGGGFYQWNPYSQARYMNQLANNYNSKWDVLLNPVNGTWDAMVYEIKNIYYTINGAYSYTKENAGGVAPVHRVITQIGQDVAYQSMIAVPPTNSEGFANLQPADIIGIPNYDPNLHDYT